MSTSCEKVYNALQQKPLDDFVKGELVIEDKLVAQIFNKEKIGFIEKYDFVKRLNLDIATITPVAQVCKKKVPRRDELEFPDVEKWANTDLFTFGLLDGPFEWGIKLYGFNYFFSLLMKSPKTVEELNRNIAQLNIEKIEELAARGVNGIIITDDIAYSQNLYIRPIMLRKFYFPIYADMVEKIRKNNLTAFFHSDGNYYPVLDDLISAGFCGIHCIDHNSKMEIKAIKQEVQDKICLWGHLTPRDLQDIEDAEKRQQVLAFAEDMLSMNGFILGTTSGLYPGINLASLEFLYGGKINCEGEK